MRGIVAPLIKLVSFLVVTSFATYVLAATISNTSFGDTRTYKADFTDVTGLNLGDDVRIAGVRVGTVSDIKIVRRRARAEVDLHGREVPPAARLGDRQPALPQPRRPALPRRRAGRG